MTAIPSRAPPDAPGGTTATVRSSPTQHLRRASAALIICSSLALVGLACGSPLRSRCRWRQRKQPQWCFLLRLQVCPHSLQRKLSSSRRIACTSAQLNSAALCRAVGEPLQMCKAT